MIFLSAKNCTDIDQSKFVIAILVFIFVAFNFHAQCITKGNIRGQFATQRSQWSSRGNYFLWISLCNWTIDKSEHQALIETHPDELFQI